MYMECNIAKALRVYSIYRSCNLQLLTGGTTSTSLAIAHVAVETRLNPYNHLPFMSVLQCTHCDLCCPNNDLLLLHNQPLGHTSLAYICITTGASLHKLSLKYSYLTHSLNESQNLTMLVFCNQYF